MLVILLLLVGAGCHLLLWLKLFELLELGYVEIYRGVVDGVGSGAIDIDFYCAVVCSCSLVYIVPCLVSCDNYWFVVR